MVADVIASAPLLASTIAFTGSEAVPSSGTNPAAANACHPVSSIDVLAPAGSCTKTLPDTSRAPTRTPATGGSEPDGARLVSGRVFVQFPAGGERIECGHPGGTRSPPPGSCRSRGTASLPVNAIVDASKGALGR